MARIELKEIAHSYLPRPSSLEDYALKPLDHVWEDGGAYALLGPSGCGKTTLLNIISGLVQPTRGKILFDGKDVTDLPPQARNIAQVFQFPVIYDTMTVFDNLAFPLRNRGLDQPGIARRVSEIAEMLDLSDVLQRRAHGLDADAKQKISLGRGLVRPDVAAVLFDEPLTVIDPHLKWQLRRKLKEVHQNLNLTLVYVTHDQLEALTFADKVVVMFEGQVVQLGTPQELFDNPQHTFVGYFIGSPGMNILPCALDGSAAVIQGAHIPLSSETASAAAALPSVKEARLEIGIRPQFLEIVAPGSAGAVDTHIEAIEDLGQFKIVTTRFGEHRLRVKVHEDTEVTGQEAAIYFPPERTKLYADGRLVG